MSRLGAVRRRVLVVAGLLAVLAVVAIVAVAGTRSSAGGETTAGTTSYTARFAAGGAVVPGEGQRVTIAGVPVGEITDVRRDRGQLRVTLRIGDRYGRMMRSDARALLRPATGTDDPVLELDPGAPSGRPVPAGWTIEAARTSPAADPDELLAALDSDTREALRLLLASGREATADGASRIADSARQAAPVARNLRRIGAALRGRGRDTREAIHSLRLVTEALADKRGDLTRAVDATNTVVGTVAGRDRELRRALRELPPTLRTTQDALARTTELADELPATTAALEPVARALEPAAKALGPFFAETEPVLREQLLPLTREAPSALRRVRSAARATSELAPDATATLKTLDGAANALAYDPPGADQGYLFWAQWLAHLAPWTFNTQDAHGPILRGQVLVSCPSLSRLMELSEVTPAGSLLSGAFGGLAASGLCPKDGKR